MYILGGKRLEDDFLDYRRAAGELRIRPRVWWRLARLHDVYLDQPRSLRRLWHYYHEVGLVSLVRRIRSRLKETLRDRRVIAVGFGEVVEADADSAFQPGAAVLFVAPCHPEFVERVALPTACVQPATGDELDRFGPPDGVYLFDDSSADGGNPLWETVAGWSRFSGVNIAPAAQALLDWARGALARLEPQRAVRLSIPRASPVCERTALPSSGSAGRSAVLFGLGNYAKVCILPNLDPGVRLRCIHEIDPTQIGPVEDSDVAYDTSDLPRADEQYDVYFIAGYHHTHVPLAVHALQQGAWAVSEKPLVTRRDQLEDLLEAMRTHPGRYFAGFHMRYNPLWDLARKDLQVGPGEPIHYNCIVFEVPLGRRHWYNLPSSGSRIVSNGCHWLDHFLFMNDWSAPTRHHLWRGGNDDIHVSVELANGACMSMVLTSVGSRRIGVQDHIQLRAGSATVRVDNGRYYMAEERFRIIRRARVPKMASFKGMYGSISRKIARNEPGDSLQSTQRSCELMLVLEELHQRRASGVDA